MAKNEFTIKEPFSNTTLIVNIPKSTIWRIKFFAFVVVVAAKIAGFDGVEIECEHA